MQAGSWREGTPHVACGLQVTCPRFELRAWEPQVTYTQTQGADHHDTGYGQREVSPGKGLELQVDGVNQGSRQGEDVDRRSVSGCGKVQHGFSLGQNKTHQGGSSQK